MAFKMKGFPMQKGTGSYLKEASAMKMKKEAMAKMKESMAKQAKPDFLDLDGDGNVTESMKAAASAAKQRRGRVERSIKRANKAADKYNTYVSGKGEKETYYVNDEEMTRYGLSEKDMKKAKRLKKRADKREDKAEKLVAKYNKKNAPTTQKYDKSDTDERVYDLDQKKYDKFRSTQGKEFPDIRYLGKKENKKFLEEYLKRKDNRIVSRSISRGGKNSPAPQKEDSGSSLIAEHNKKMKEILGKYHGKGIDSTGYAKTGNFKVMDTDQGKKALEKIRKAEKKSIDKMKKQGAKQGVKITKSK